MADKSIREPIYATYKKIAEELVEQDSLEDFDHRKLESLAKEIFEQFQQINQVLLISKYGKFKAISCNG